MTNTLHRFGSAESFADDIIVFAITSKGKNDDGSVPKLKKFLSMAIAHSPVNMGDGAHGGAIRASEKLNPTSHWKRAHEPNFQEVVEDLDKPTTAAVVFDKRENAVAFVKAVKEAGLGLCVNISTSVEGAESILDECGIARHSVNYSCGFQNRTEKLPSTQVLALTTMCGHGMIAQTMARKMIDFVKEGRRTPEEAAKYLSRFCACGVYNPARAQRIIEDARKHVE
jgi:hypothetical protein